MPTSNNGSSSSLSKARSDIAIHGGSFGRRFAVRRSCTHCFSAAALAAPQAGSPAVFDGRMAETCTAQFIFRA